MLLNNHNQPVAGGGRSQRRQSRLRERRVELHSLQGWMARKDGSHKMAETITLLF